MTPMKSLRKVVKFPGEFAGRIAADKRGVAAIEFALIAPLLIGMYFVTMEIAPAIDSSKKVGRSASMIADLVTQSSTVTKVDIQSIMRLGEATIMPYSRTKLNVIVTAIDVTNDNPPKAKVAWSHKMDNGNFSADLAKDTIVTIPADLRVAGSFYIKVETGLTYKPMLTWNADANKGAGLLSGVQNIDMGETYYLRPRITPRVTCSDC